jgi:hypothetical protein
MEDNVVSCQWSVPNVDILQFKKRLILESSEDECGEEEEKEVEDDSGIQSDDDKVKNGAIVEEDRTPIPADLIHRSTLYVEEQILKTKLEGGWGNVIKVFCSRVQVEELCMSFVRERMVPVAGQEAAGKMLGDIYSDLADSFALASAKIDEVRAG